MLTATHREIMKSALSGASGLAAPIEPDGAALELHLARPEGWEVLARPATSEGTPEYQGLQCLEKGAGAIDASRPSAACCYRVVDTERGRHMVMFWLVKNGSVLDWPIVDPAEPVDAVAAARTMLVDGLRGGGPAVTLLGSRADAAGGHQQLWFECRFSAPDTAPADAKTGMWVLPWEIVQGGRAGPYSIDPAVRRAFRSEPRLAHLRLRGGRLAEPPRPGYVAAEPGFAVPLITLGPGRGAHTEPFGPFLYLDLWAEAKAKNALSPGGQIGRFAVFAGVEACTLARPCDPPDRSPLSAHLAGARPVIRAALRARDADGRWSDTADSVCRGRTAIVVSGQRTSVAPRFAVRTCSQVYPLGLLRPSSSKDA